MSLFKHRYHYPIPERITPADARQRRLASLLERERRFEEVPNFKQTVEALRSRVNQERLTSLSKAIVNDPQTRGHKAASIAAALKLFQERDFADPQKRKAYRALRAMQAAASVGGRQKVQPSGSDNRRFNPAGAFPSTIYGTAAQISGRLASNVSALSGWSQVFKNPWQVIPCIQRTQRREVMFALKHAGRGYHTRKRRTFYSGVPC